MYALVVPYFDGHLSGPQEEVREKEQSYEIDNYRADVCIADAGRNRVGIRRRRREMHAAQAGLCA